ncbi:MAG: phenyltransferase domain-containing protein [Deltaproteobacteria bacterium HGW-Deltaproteobacteria-19]|jgi:hypothetical protein|nr:MAG: phenyltransferase domain-containing protein [Deltaproteobacteria bacterium HGW-Deltaproteobacteria-19]
MERTLTRPALKPDLKLDMEATAGFIAGVQKTNGEIPWSVGGKTDPWDHVESAMGLVVAGYLEEARRAYQWLADTQLPDGSWWSGVRDGVVEDSSKDSNFSSYAAVGVFHYGLVTGDWDDAFSFWPMVEGGIEFALALQAPTGEIYWARNKEGVADPMALLTGSSSIFMSVKCALAMAERQGLKRPRWEEALKKLGHAILYKPNRFNMIKSRFSMDWYYPVLCGALQGQDARRRIDRYWERFVVPDWGVRCVCDRPWATMAETSELVLALDAVGEHERAKAVFNWILDKKYDDGSYWMGVTFPDAVIWPEERTAWTAAAVLLAYDALCGLTPGGRLFRHGFWENGKPR